MTRAEMKKAVFAAMLAASVVALTACGGNDGRPMSGVSSSGSGPAQMVSPVPASATTTAASSPSTNAASAAATASTSGVPAPASDSGASPFDPPPAADPDRPDTSNTDTAPDDTNGPPAATNTVPITIDNTLGTVVNLPYVSVTICAPGTQGAHRCASVDHMLVDTGSVGVRVTAAALGSALTAQLPQQTGASNDTTSRAPIAQCAIFASGYTWGSIRRADVAIGGEQAADIPVHVIGDGAYPTTPTDCVSRGGASMNTASTLGANGIVGIGHLARDFPQAAQSALAASYYYCPTPSSCTPARVPIDRQTMNPVAAFATDNNGTLIRLPALPPGGQLSVAGELVFGIGTRANNALPAEPVYLSVSDRGAFTTRYNDRTTTSVIDSGSNGLFFPDASIPVWSGWYAPAVTQTRTATLISNTGNLQTTIPFTIANALNLFATSYAAYDNLGAPASSLFIWGLPFFYGRSVYTALSGMPAGSRSGPYVAF